VVVVTVGARVLAAVSTSGSSIGLSSADEYSRGVDLGDSTVKSQMVGLHDVHPRHLSAPTGAARRRKRAIPVSLRRVATVTIRNLLRYRMNQEQ
jgi:hypothetical protein